MVALSSYAFFALDDTNPLLIVLEDGIIGHQNKVSGIATQYSNGLLGENGQNACIGHFNHVVALVKGYGDLLVEWIDRSS